MVRTQKFDLDTDTTLGGNNASDYIAPSQKAIKDYVDNHSGGGSPVWGNITGTLSNQTDLQNALNNKVSGVVDVNGIIIGTDSTATYGVVVGNNSALGGALSGGVIVGNSSGASEDNSIVVGEYSTCITTSSGIVIGNSSQLECANGSGIVIGNDISALFDNGEKKLIVGLGTAYELCDLSTGLIPDARLNTTIARTSQIPTESTVSGWGFTKNTGTVTSVNGSTPDSSGNVNITIPNPLPSQSGQSGRFLTTNGSDASWENVYDIFWCNTTTYLSEVGAALNVDYKLPVFKDDDGNVYIYNSKSLASGSSTYTFIFNSIDPINNNIKYYTLDAPNTWTAHTSSIGTVTSVNNVQPVNGNVTLDTTEIFLCTPNVTTYAEITTALNANKIPVIIVNNKIYIYTQSSGSGFYDFNYVDGDAVHYYSVDTSNNWTSLTWTNETTTNKVTNLTQYSTDTQYPSAKCVFNLLETIYPVGSVYLSTNSTCPLASLFGTWELVSSGRALWTGTGSNGGSTINAGLPNIVGFLVRPEFKTKDNTSGSFYNEGSENGRFQGTSSGSWYARGTNFDASRSSSIYGNSTTVQPPAYVVNVWRRTA